MMTSQQFHRQFQSSKRPHVLMLTVHGVHAWDVIPGLQDTGGQNVFVNQFSGALEQQGFKVTIVNRGGYSHPRTGIVQAGLDYHDACQRILYLEDGLDSFVRKEDMGGRIPDLSRALISFVRDEGLPIHLIISHYWDGGRLGSILAEEGMAPVQHVWVPHSLGMVKQRNLPMESREDLRIPDRVKAERKILAEVDYVAATSSIIHGSAREDYGYEGKMVWLPPCIDPQRYHPRDIGLDHPVWNLLRELTDLPADELQSRRIILEISRTDRTKQKDVLIRAFAQVVEKHPDSMLVISIDRENAPLGHELYELIQEEGIAGSTAVVGSVWDILPAIYAVSDIYCTPSIMEGFGMSVQEAAATRLPVISSNLVPFATEYLKGESPGSFQTGSETEILVGEGAVIVQPGDIQGFSTALDLLLSDEDLRISMGSCAYSATVPYFTWDHIVRDFLSEIRFKG